MKKNLILLTKQFPFQHREQYVAHEIEVLSKHFERIYIYPHDHFGKNDLPSFQLPQNVEVIDLNQRIVPVPKSEVISGFVSAFTYEFTKTHSRAWLLGNARRFYSIYATQYALGNGLMNFMDQKKIKQEETVFYSYWFSASALCLSILKSRKLIQRFVSRAHALDLYHEAWGLLNEKVRVLPFRYFKQSQTDIIYSISEHGKKFLEQKPGLVNRVEVAHLGVHDFGLNPETGDRIFTIVTCSGVDDNKRIHLLGKALRELDRKVRWIHFGDGPLKEKALDSVGGSVVEFEYRGQTENQSIRSFYSKTHVDLFVNLSRVEGLPVTIMEAISHGIPVLATDANGTPEAIEGLKNGRLISVDFTTEQLKEQLKWFFDHHSELGTMRVESRSLFERKFDAGKNYKEFSILLQSE